MKIAIACDHGGFALKAELLDLVRALGHEPADLGAHRLDPDDDYPDYARCVGQAIQHGQADRGIILCGSGAGACVAANKMAGVRATVAHDAYSAAQCVEHDDVNVLCLGARVIGPALAGVLVRTFLGARFSPQPRYARRLDKVKAIEAAR